MIHNRFWKTNINISKGDSWKMSICTRCFLLLLLSIISLSLSLPLLSSCCLIVIVSLSLSRCHCLVVIVSLSLFRCYCLVVIVFYAVVSLSLGAKILGKFHLDKVFWYSLTGALDQKVQTMTSWC